MARILVVGGTGALGRELLARLPAAGHTVRATSRKEPFGEQNPAAEWVRADVITGSGLDAAVQGMDAVINAVNDAGKTSHDAMVSGTERLLDASRRAGVHHFIYPSIVGIDLVPLTYYKHKLAAEERITDFGVPYTILRATQFHGYVDYLLHRTDRLPIPIIPSGRQLQPVDVGDVAQALVEAVAQGPAGRAPDFAGPEILPLRAITRQWLIARGKSPRMISVPFPGKVSRALHGDALTNPNARRGTITWADWLKRNYRE